MKEFINKKINEIVRLEHEFDNFVKTIGYHRISNDIDSSPKFQNADYINKQIKSIIELKIINKEFFKNGGIINPINAIIIKPESIDKNGGGQYQFEIQPINREGTNDNFEEPLRRIIKKANNQIKETKDYYGYYENYYGFLIIAQLGLSSLSPEITGMVAKKIITSEFSSIDGIIICTPYNPSINPVTMKNNPECVSVTKNIFQDKRKLCMEIADNWIKFYENGGHQK